MTNSSFHKTSFILTIILISVKIILQVKNTISALNYYIRANLKLMRYSIFLKFSDGGKRNSSFRGKIESTTDNMLVMKQT